MIEKNLNLLKSLGFVLLVAAVLIYIIATGDEVMWSGFIAMLVFYALMYYVGAYFAAKKSDSLDDMMVAKRSLPLVIMIFTMAATWVGGGYINGTAESTYVDGLVWAQAPWGYALSLIIGGIF